MKLARKKGFVETFGLRSFITTRNMHLYDGNGKIKKYDTPEQILEGFVEFRLKHFRDGVDSVINNLRHKLDIVQEQIQFVVHCQTSEVNKVFQEKEGELSARQHLLSMPLSVLTDKGLDGLKKEQEKLKTQVDNLQKIHSDKSRWLNQIEPLVDILKKEEGKILMEADDALKSSSHKDKVNGVLLFVQLLRSLSDDIRSKAVRVLLCECEKKEPSDLLLRCGALMPLLQLLLQLVLDNEHLSKLIEAAQILPYLCDSNSLPGEVKFALPILKRLIDLNDENVLRHACLALSNLSYGTDQIQTSIETGVVPRLVELLDHDSQYVVGHAVRTISFIGRKASAEQIQSVIDSCPVPALNKIITQSNNEPMISAACNVISSITYLNQEQIQIVIDANLVPKLVTLLDDPHRQIVYSALLCIANITSQDDSQLQGVMDVLKLSSLAKFFDGNYEERIIQTACYTISNITTGNQKLIKELIDAKLIPLMGSQLRINKLLPLIKDDVAIALSNVTQMGSHLIRDLVKQGCLQLLCDLLKVSEPVHIETCLEGLTKILEAGESLKSSNLGVRNKYAKQIEEGNWLEKIEELRNHDIEAVRLKASFMINNYWGSTDMITS